MSHNISSTRSHKQRKKPGIFREDKRDNSQDERDNDKEKTRRLLAIAIICLIPLSLVVYIITRDAAVVATTSIIGVAAASVCGHYFR